MQMKNRESPHIRNLEKWVIDIDRSLRSNALPMINQSTVNQVLQALSEIAKEIKDEYPFYSAEIPGVSNILFVSRGPGFFSLNTAAFGELFLIIKHLVREPSDTQFWLMIHPRICSISKNLYCDGYFDSAAEKAVKEIETRLRELFQEIKPGVAVPKGVTDIIGALLSDQGSYQFCDTSTSSGQNYRRGIKLLFDGVFAAYRNPSAHENLQLSKRSAFDQITLASQLMFVLDNK